jgi:hypothetical protein
MNSIAEAMIKDINVLLAASLPPFRESKTWHNGVWTVDARYGFRRIENVAREHVLSIANVTVAKPLRGMGSLTEFLDRVLDDPRLFLKPVDWIYFEQVQYRLGNHLIDRHGFTAERGLVTDAWRRVTPQLALAI